jgi:hypothetical protein
MKLVPLYDLQHEINRLFIAGSKFAKNDPRLQKQAAVFNTLGEKSPVFKKIAEGIDSLVNAEALDSPTKLLELSTLLYAVLYTQGETVDAEQPTTELTPVLPLKDVRTDNSHLALKPVIEALSTQRSGRLYDVQRAFENGQFNDFRLYPLFDTALADRYAEFVDYIETTIIPAIGAPIIPFILNSFSYADSVDDVRRFRILYSLGYSGIPEMVDTILEGKSVALQVEAVKTLHNDPANEELLIKLAGDKQKNIRFAAYEALSNLNTETAQRVLVDLFVAGKKKSDVSELGEVLRLSLSNKFVPVILEKARCDYEKCIELDKSSDIKAIINALEGFATSLTPLLNNLNDEVLKFCKEAIKNKKYRELSKIANSKTNRSYIPEWLDEML